MKFKLVIVVLATCAWSCSTKDRDKAQINSAATAAIVTSSDAFSKYLHNSTQLDAALETASTKTFSDQYKDMLSQLPDHKVVVDGLDIDNVRQLLSGMDDQFKNADKSYGSLGGLWDKQNISRDVRPTAAEVRDGLHTAIQFLKKQKNSGSTTLTNGQGPASLALLDINCKAVDGTALACSLASTIACAFSWIPIIGQIACAVTTACAVAAGVTQAATQASCTTSSDSKDDGFKTGKWTKPTTTQQNSCSGAGTNCNNNHGDGNTYTLYGN